MTDTPGRPLVGNRLEAGDATRLAEAVRMIVGSDARTAALICDQARTDVGEFFRAHWRPDLVIVTLLVELAMVAHHSQQSAEQMVGAIGNTFPAVFDAYGREFMDRHAVSQADRDASEGVVVPAHSFTTH